MIGLFSENGPLSFVGNSTRLDPYPYAWTKLGHVLYIDQPVGTGFSTASHPNPVAKNDRVTSDFYAWLKSFYRKFPHLMNKKTHLVGESYGGIFVPYFASEIMKNHDIFPVNLVSISIGNGVFGNSAAMSDVVAGSYLRSNSALLGIQEDILNTFSTAEHLCGFDSVLEQGNQYPPRGPIHIPGNPENLNFKRWRRDEPLDAASTTICSIDPTTPLAVFSSILNSTCYGPCAAFSTAADYLDSPTALTQNPCFNIYNIKYDCNTANPLGPITLY